MIGSIGLALVLALAAAGLTDSYPAPLIAGALVLGVLIWAAMLRPGLWITTTSLVMRNMLETVDIPLAAIEEVAVRQVVSVLAGDRRYVSSAVGRSLRQVVKGGGARPDAAGPGTSYADYVEDRIRVSARDAAAAAGIRPRSEEQLALGAQVRRTPAWLEIAVLAVTLVAFVATLVL